MPQLREDQSRQAAKDAEYFRLCKEHNIPPESPGYSGGCPERNEGLTDSLALEAGEIAMFPASIAIDEDDAAERPDYRIPKATQAAFEGFLDLLTPCRENLSDRFIQIVGRRIVALNWMLQRGECAGKSLAEIGREIGCERATLSRVCRQIEESCGFRGRGQKRVGAHEIYRESRLRVVERQLAEKHDATLAEDALSVEG